ncbi:hypothetical protein M011DRAFT_403309 [Sporormia fimetaria CBS 119925]|uniref:Zn(2)-C6 fungal-type domain-containing protein n=1 Tax=Sporormia fimetaria CBS 119925 TaxID=1340428 RepID=A0A6A6V8X8_9PLEO|nr:hypothetical protein M011DRAFT_403309 [Sporormia fimetaria CBS 119925]
MAGSPAYAAPGTRRKQVRAQQACNHCRQRKQKCDEQKPCQFCRDNNIPDCTYKEVPPPKQDKSMQQLQSSVNHIQDTLAAFIEGFNTWKREVDSRNQQSKVSDSVGTPSNQLSPEQTYPVRGSVSERSLSHVGTPQGRLPFLGPTSVKTESPIMHMSPLSAHAHTPGTYDHIVASVQHPSTPADSIRTDSSGAKQDGSKTDTSGIQGDHATPAHKVLQDWKCMTGFCDGIETIRILKEQGHNISDYPMKLEYARGIVRPFGVGEGNDKSDGSQAPATPCSQASDTPSPPGGGTAMWGTLSTPPPDGILLEDTPGGLGRDGYLKLDEDTLTRLLGSYQKHIHTLHPFLNPGELRRMVKAFGRNYGPNGHTRSAGTKRKRSAGGVNGFPSPFLFAHHSIERSLSNAIVLLVLALGKVCEWKSPLPAPQADKAPPESTLYGFKRASLRNANNTSFSSDYEDERRARNMEILPGMAYFSMATDILGNQIGGNTTGHAQAMLLAGLYMGQYARVLESWSWINSACRVCLVLVKEELPFIRRLGPLKGEEKDKNRRNVIKCVYWTCLQLESDIIAEMSNLTPTDISKYWDEIAYPEGVLDDDELRSGQELDHTSEHVKMMFLYSMQIYLRTLLNSAHNALYNGKYIKGNLDLADHDSLIKLAAEARSLQEGLRAWRNRLPPEYRWNDGDPPSTDLNIARLRAKYYGGKYMIHRTFLNMLLHNISLNSNKLTAQMLESATTCIDSAIYSTIAFDRVGMDPGSKYEPFVDLPRDRLIVTNIMGTLHAQFGNMTVLCSVFKSRKCGEMLRFTKLTREVMELLIVRTIKILRSVGDNSPILTLDADILENVQRQLFPKH